jgi:2-keto-4-pentenoate hydratase/2-oxohepta-3-ene-1,7-dioic acid hydratase in catechol pathway
MKVATVSIADERRVGLVTDDGRSITPYLKNGDVVRIEIGGIGVLENEIVERSA